MKSHGSLMIEDVLDRLMNGDGVVEVEWPRMYGWFGAGAISKAPYREIQRRFDERQEDKPKSERYQLAKIEGGRSLWLLTLSPKAQLPKQKSKRDFVAPIELVRWKFEDPEGDDE